MSETSISGIEFKIVGTTGKAKSAVDKLTASLKGLKTALHTTSAKKLEKDLEGVEKSTKKTTTTLGKLFKSVGRITFYRTIRAALRFITEGLKEGLENAYQFSKMVGYELAGTMDNLATKSLTMKNQLGSAFGSLIQTLEPILIQIISFVTKAANAFAQLFAIIGGRKTYLKAVDTMTQYGEAIGGVGQAAKEAMKYLAPFDELNVLPADSGSGSAGGGASTPDYSQMFEVAEVDADSILGSLANMFNDMADWFEKQDWKSLGSSVWEGLSNAFSDEGKADEVIQALFRTIGSVTGAVVGFTWGFISEAVESIMESFKNSIRDYNGDNKIGITDVLTGIWNTAISPFVWIDENIVKPFWRGFTGALLGAEKEPLTVNDVMGWVFDNLNDQAIINWVKTKAVPWLSGGLKDFADEASLVLTGMKAPDLWAWLTDGWKDIKTELYNIFIKPIVDAFDEFAQNHPVIAKFLGIENGASDVITPGAEAANSMWNIDIEADIKSVKDSVPPEDKVSDNWTANMEEADDEKLPLWKRVINKVKGIFSDTDSSKLTQDQTTLDTTANFKYRAPYSESLPMDKRTFDATANFKYTAPYSSEYPLDKRTFDAQARYKYSLVDELLYPLSKRTFDSRAKYTSTQNSLTLDQRTFDSVAKYKYRNDEDFPLDKRTFDSVAKYKYRNDEEFPLDKRTFDSVAKYKYRNDALSDEQKTLDTTAEFTTWKDKLSNVWSYAKASFNTWENNISEYDNPWLWTEAIFKYWEDSIDGTPYIDSTANLTDAVDNIPDNQKYIEMSASIIGIPGMNGYAKGGAYYGSAWHDIPQAATGGKFHGSLFWAGEAGPEIVGHAGGRTEVLNRSQLASTMYAAVTRAMSGIQFSISGMGTPTSAQAESYDEDTMYRAMLRALNDSNIGDEEISIDGDVLFKKMVQRNQMNTRMTGVNAMATA